MVPNRFQITLRDLALEDGVLYVREVFSEEVEHQSRSVGPHVVHDDNVHHGLPPPLEGYIFLSRKEVLFQFVRFNSEEILIAHLPIQSGMLHGLFERLLEGF